MEPLLPFIMISMFTPSIRMTGARLRVQTLLFHAVDMLGAEVAMREVSTSLEVRFSVNGQQIAKTLIIR